MKVSFESKGNFNNTEAWLKRMSTMDDSSKLNAIKSAGTSSLARSTPQATGETAASWKAKTERSFNVTEISWYNTAHPGAGVNIAKLIDLGHGTRTGGYVPPRPYIKNSMTPVWNSLDKLLKELIK